MNSSNYKQATPIIKQLDDIAIQHDSVAKTNQIKIETNGTIVLVNVANFGDDGIATVRNAVLKVLNDKSEALKKELDKL